MLVLLGFRVRVSVRMLSVASGCWGSGNRGRFGLILVLGLVLGSALVLVMLGFRLRVSVSIVRVRFSIARV